MREARTSGPPALATTLMIASLHALTPAPADGFHLITSTMTLDGPSTGPSSSTTTNRRDFLSAGTSAAAGAASSGFLAGPGPASVVGAASAYESILPPGAGGPIKLPPLGLGAWAWGDTLFWGYDKKNDSDLREVFDYAVSKDVAFFDTAEIYGFGRSETLLGQFRSALPQEEAGRVQIATKFAALPFRTKARDVVDACRKSVQRLGGDRPIDLYQIHFPNAWSNAEYWDGLALAVEEGLVKSVGVSNYGVDAVRATHAALAERGIKLATNQIQLSLLYRFPLENGLVDACKELDVQVLSYSPLALGFLTGKYSKGNLPSGPRKALAEKLFETDDLPNLVRAMELVGANHGGAPPSQVALNWARAKGTVPIPGARSLKQARQNVEALDWSLTGEELRLLDDAAAKVPAYITPDKSPFPKKDMNTGLVMFDS